MLPFNPNLPAADLQEELKRVRVDALVLPGGVMNPDALRMVDGRVVGNTQAVAWLLYRVYLLPFEVTSIRSGRRRTVLDSNSMRIGPMPRTWWVQ